MSIELSDVGDDKNKELPSNPNSITLIPNSIKDTVAEDEWNSVAIGKIW